MNILECCIWGLNVGSPNTFLASHLHEIGVCFTLCLAIVTVRGAFFRHNDTTGHIHLSQNVLEPSPWFTDSSYYFSCAQIQMLLHSPGIGQYAIFRH